ncbi:MAG: hypothetical protein LRY71_07520 [Bacillaceae bacterium]|nr:hypothetical protein [Bacillaceae bacterium]
MSLKAIEMQVALPRTQTAGKIQDQLQQRGQVSQGHLATQQEKADELKRTKITDAEKTQNKRLNNDDVSSGKQHSFTRDTPKKNDKDNKQQEIFAKHPYKGNYVDFSG